MEPARITLALGPTNTGKTHRAVERMLEHDSAMIGLPLRLLAREVYDRISARVGEQAVALVTGEEKRVPRAPRYWVCTVEAMPDRVVDFLAIDEIQLAAHRERGHVFTDRFLRARGTLETWFLGADTMAPIARELIEGAALHRQPRLSTLRYAGRTGLGALPPRSAAIAFSAEEVYALAARLKARRGGAAVVLGALSPRTRNAQVALYQAGEVGYLVATDAIGMGLNLDVDHVAFAATHKFDGREHRPLETDELAQIAGRAGRHRKDGTFGTINPTPPLGERVVRAIEEHRFPAVRRLVWRNAELDFASVDALIGSLAAPPPDPRFSRVEQADDFDALRALAERPEVRARASDEASRRLLWELCQVPDYQKLFFLRHVGLLQEMYAQLLERGRLDTDYVEGHVRRIDHVGGDVDDLTARLAAIRVWTYVSHRAAWLEDAEGWQERARAIEDRLGDALHERLIERFVEVRRASASAGPIDAAGPFAQLGGLLRERREAMERDRDRWIEDLIEAPHEALRVDAEGAIHGGSRVVAHLAAGRSVSEPELRLALPDEVGAGARARIERRLVAFVKDWVAELLAPLRPRPEPEGALRGLLYQLEQGLGTITRREAHAQLEALDRDARRRLDALSIEVGRQTVYVASMLEPEPMQRRAALVRAFAGASKQRAAKAGAADARLTGHVLCAGHAVRADRVERGLALLRTDEAAAADAFGIPRDALERVAKSLGLRRGHEGGWIKRRPRRA